MTLHQVNIVISNFPTANFELSLFSVFLVDDKEGKGERESVGSSLLNSRRPRWKTTTTTTTTTLFVPNIIQ